MWCAQPICGARAAQIRSNGMVVVGEKIVHKPNNSVLARAAAVAGALALVWAAATPAHAATGLDYLGTDGTPQHWPGEYELIEDADPANLDGWYLCDSTVDLGPMQVQGEAHLVLADGCDLTAVSTTTSVPGIRVQGTNSLTVYAASDGPDQGSLTAHGGASAAGIGAANGGYAGRGGSVTIAGGTVAATGGVNAAGIGTGYRTPNGTVTITGGTVTASGGYYGSGIGGGSQSAVGTVTITGGTVTATGSISAPGLGTDTTYYGGGAIQIGGNASVTANGAFGAPGLGAGEQANGNTVTVGVATSGSVTAMGGSGISIGHGSTPTAWLVTTSVVGNGSLLPAGVVGLPAGAVQGTFSVPVGSTISKTFDAVPDAGESTIFLLLDGAPLTDRSGHTVTDIQHNQTLAAEFGVLALVSAVSVALDAPELAEALPTTATTPGSDYTVSGLSWSPTHDPAGPVTVYTATMTVTASPYHEFDASTEVTVNGMPATVDLEVDGTLTATFTFAATDEDAYLVTLSGSDTDYVYGDGPITVTTSVTSGTGMPIDPAHAPTVTIASSAPTVATVVDHGDGTATVTILRAGTFTLTATATATGITTHTTGTDDIAVTVTPATAVVELARPDSATLTVTVTGSGGVPEGTVTLYRDGAAVTADVPLIDGAAEFTIAPPTTGRAVYTATFNGETDHYTAADSPEFTVLAAQLTATGNAVSVHVIGAALVLVAAGAWLTFRARLRRAG